MSIFEDSSPLSGIIKWSLSSHHLLSLPHKSAVRKSRNEHFITGVEKALISGQHGYLWPSRMLIVLFCFQVSSIPVDYLSTFLVGYPCTPLPPESISTVQTVQAVEEYHVWPDPCFSPGCSFHRLLEQGESSYRDWLMPRLFVGSETEVQVDPLISQAWTLSSSIDSLWGFLRLAQNLKHWLWDLEACDSGMMCHATVWDTRGWAICLGLCICWPGTIPGFWTPNSEPFVSHYCSLVLSKFAFTRFSPSWHSLEVGFMHFILMKSSLAAFSFFQFAERLEFRGSYLIILISCLEIVTTVSSSWSVNLSAHPALCRDTVSSLCLEIFHCFFFERKKVQQPSRCLLLFSLS